MLKKRIFRLLSLFCAAVIVLSYSPAVNADSSDGKMYSSYAYVLNDYLYTYGAMSTQNAGDSFQGINDGLKPNGVIYSEIISFDDTTGPCMVIFLAEEKYNAAAFHIWKYDDENETAERIGVIASNYTALTDGQVGVFSLGCSEESKNFITYKTFDNGVLSSAAFYTVMNGDTFRYVNKPQIKNEVGIMDFSSSYFHPGVNISDGNKNIYDFFTTLKDKTEENISFENVAPNISDNDDSQIRQILKKSLALGSFDIAGCDSSEAYTNTLNNAGSSLDDNIPEITGVYDLGDKIYYIRFSTERSLYNYAMLRKSDEADGGYQLLKSDCDSIPLAASEISSLKTDYSRNTLLLPEAKSGIELVKSEDKDSGDQSSKKELFHFDKILNKQSRLPIICIGGGISIALLTILWVYLYSDND